MSDEPTIDKEREWAMIRTLFKGPRLIDAEKVKADTKGNEPMDEESRLKPRATHKCPYCGEDVLEEGYEHCSALCLLGSTHNLADEIVKEATKDLPAMPRHKIGSRDEVGWRFYEVEKRVEELEKMLIAHRRFTVYFLACLYAVSLAIALWIVSLHG